MMSNEELGIGEHTCQHLLDEPVSSLSLYQQLPAVHVLNGTRPVRQNSINNTIL